MNTWMKRGLFALLGGVGGFAYYYFIGCTGGTCPITSSPYISTAYGILMGTVVGWSSKPKSPAAN
ncbi:MAG: hypothetical protein ACKVRP_02090 [Bacteroidota bacterium]